MCWKHLGELVVKEVHGSGGYGMLVGPASTREQQEIFRAAEDHRRPDNYIVQPTLALSTCPTYVERGIAPRHVDLRPFVLVGDQIRITPGGLTRVALNPGRWWSIPARAAAPRTPGCWRNEMLGRIAQSLFWLSRYIERAENMARLLAVGYRMSLTSRR